MKRLLPPIALALLANASGAAAQNADGAKLATEVCSTCHGPRGESISSAFPRLAGQQAQYLDVQLKAFRDRTRGDPMAQAYMWGMASQLDDASIASLSAYYSAQKPVQGGKFPAKLTQEGKTIFESGVVGTNSQPCVTCHGKNGEGNSIYPRLAGQHAEYLVKQLVLFKSQLRADTNATIMHNISSAMSFEQMEAVAAYLASR